MNTNHNASITATVVAVLMAAIILAFAVNGWHAIQSGMSIDTSDLRELLKWVLAAGVFGGSLTGSITVRRIEKRHEKIDPPADRND